MSLQITDDNWQLIVDKNVDSNVREYLLGTFTNPFVIVSIESTSANPIWREAGTISEAISFEEQLAYGSKKELFLRQLNLLSFNALSGSDYQLYYFPLTRLAIVNLKVWEYQGETRDTLIQQLTTALENSEGITLNFPDITQKLTKIANQNNNTSIDLAAIKSKLDRICELLNDTDRPVNPTSEETLFFLFN